MLHLVPVTTTHSVTMKDRYTFSPLQRPIMLLLYVVKTCHTLLQQKTVTLSYTCRPLLPPIMLQLYKCSQCYNYCIPLQMYTLLHLNTVTTVHYVELVDRYKYPFMLHLKTGTTVHYFNNLSNRYNSLLLYTQQQFISPSRAIFAPLISRFICQSLILFYMMTFEWYLHTAHWFAMNVNLNKTRHTIVFTIYSLIIIVLKIGQRNIKVQ